MLNVGLNVEFYTGSIFSHIDVELNVELYVYNVCFIPAYRITRHMTPHGAIPGIIN